MIYNIFYILYNYNRYCFFIFSKKCFCNNCWNNIVVMRRDFKNAIYKVNFLTVRLGDTLKFVLLLDGVAVAWATSGIDEFISQALGNRLDVTESSLSSTSAQEPDSLVNTSQRRNINSLTPDCTLTTNTGRVFTGSGVDDSVDNSLKGVLTSCQVNDFEAVLDNSNSHQLLTVVAAVHHKAVNHTLNNGALGLLEPLGSIPSGGVGKVTCSLLFDGNVIVERHVLDVHILGAPSVEKLDLNRFSNEWCGRSLLLLHLLHLVIPICFCHFLALVEVNQAILAL